MRILIKYRNSVKIIFLLLSIFFLFPNNANASTLEHSFRIKMPDGNFMYLTPAQAGVHTVYIDASNGGSGINSLNLKSVYTDGVCTETPTSTIGNQTVQACRVNVGCNFSTWSAPYLKPEFDIRTLGIQKGVAGNIRGSNTNEARWIGNVNSICPNGQGDNCNSNFLRTINVTRPSGTNGVFLDAFPDGQAFTRDMRQDIRKLKFDYNTVLLPRYLATRVEGINYTYVRRNSEGEEKTVTVLPLDEIWKQGIGSTNDWNNNQFRTQEVAYDGVGGNVLHGSISWTLEFPVANNPKCSSFNVYKADGTLLSTPANGSGQIDLSVSNDDSFSISVSATDPDATLQGKKIDVCWSVPGQAQDFYAKGAGAFVCESFTANTDGKVQTQARKFQDYVNMMLDDSKNPQSQKIEDGVKQTIRNSISTSGLIFVTNIRDNTETFMCSSNIGWNNGQGVLFGGPYTNMTIDPNKCAVTPQGRICKAIVKVSAPRCGDNICDTGEKCDSSKVCDGGTISSGQCRISCTYCGDGVVSDGEECDPRDPATSANCETNCKNKVVVQQPRCGDNLCNNAQETCDATVACRGTGMNSSFVCRAAGTAAECTYCGDGIVNGGEECDDGNTNNNDGCNTSCLKPNLCDAPCTSNIGCGGGLTCQNGKCDGAICEEPPQCGDNKCDTGESCDGNIKCLGNGELGAGECRSGSNNECTYCGDGIVQTTAGEQCDDGNTTNADGCSNNCTLAAQPRCGDGVCDSGDKCEGSISCLNNQSLKNGQICRLDCTYCGDSIVQTGEQCDEGGETAACTSSCVRKTVPTITGIVTRVPTPVPTLPPTDLDADDIWMYTMGMGLIGLGLIAYRLNLGYKFAGIVMNNGGFSILLKLRNSKKKIQRKGIFKRSNKDFERDFIKEDN